MVWHNKLRILSDFVRNNVTYYYSVKLLHMSRNIHILEYAYFKLQNLTPCMRFGYHRHFKFCHVLLWPVKYSTSCGNFMQGIESHFLCQIHCTPIPDYDAVVLKLIVDLVTNYYKVVTKIPT